jgi:hypothetical protein
MYIVVFYNNSITSSTIRSVGTNIEGIPDSSNMFEAIQSNNSNHTKTRTKTPTTFLSR